MLRHGHSMNTGIFDPIELMTETKQITNKAAYETRRQDGEIYGKIEARDWNRFKQTLKWIPRDTRSILDAGCDRGHWLSFVHTHRSIDTSLGIDVAESRILEAQATYPKLDFQSGYLEELGIAPSSFDVVTSLEVLEHIPDWIGVLDRLLGIAKRRVVITVPYRERIIQTICVHCGELTPMYGHLHRFDESTFPERDGWRSSFGYVYDYGIGANRARRIYRMIRPWKSWLAAIYDAQ